MTTPAKWEEWIDSLPTQEYEGAATILMYEKEEIKRSIRTLFSDYVEGWKPTLEWWRNHGLNQCNYDECYCQSAYEITLFSDYKSRLLSEVEKKQEWFKKAENGTTDSSIYARAVVATLNDVKALIRKEN